MLSINYIRYLLIIILVTDPKLGLYGGQIAAPKQSSGMIEVRKRIAAKEKKQKESNLNNEKGQSSTKDLKRRDEINSKTM